MRTFSRKPFNLRVQRIYIPKNIWYLHVKHSKNSKEFLRKKETLLQFTEATDLSRAQGGVWLRPSPLPKWDLSLFKKDLMRGVISNSAASVGEGV